MPNKTVADWFLPAFCVALGAVFLAAALAGGHPVVGITSFVVMLVYAGMLVALGARSDTVAILRGQPPDERLAGFNLRATAHAGSVAMVLTLAAYAWQIAHGDDGLAFIVILAPTGLAYFASLLWQRARD